MSDKNTALVLTAEEAQKRAKESYLKMKATRGSGVVATVKTPVSINPPPASPSNSPPHVNATSHVTKEGKPDRRYAENQHLSPQEAEIEKARQILRQAGITTV